MALPLILSALGVSGSDLWRVTSAAFLLVGFGVTLWVVRNLRRLADRSDTASSRMAMLLNFLAVLAPLSNITGWPLSPNAGLHLASIWLLLGIASINFLNLVVVQILREPPT